VLKLLLLLEALRCKLLSLATVKLVEGATATAIAVFLASSSSALVVAIIRLLLGDGL